MLNDRTIAGAAARAVKTAVLDNEPPSSPSPTAERDCEIAVPFRTIRFDKTEWHGSQPVDLPVDRRAHGGRLRTEPNEGGERSSLSPPVSRPG
jgi:hypothetical protein